MLKILFMILFISLIIKIFYTNIEKFSVSIQNASSNASNASLTPEKNASAIDIHDSNIIASTLKKKFITRNIQNRKLKCLDTVFVRLQW